MVTINTASATIIAIPTRKYFQRLRRLRRFVRRRQSGRAVINVG